MSAPIGSLIHHTIKTLLYKNELILDIKLQQYKKKKIFYHSKI